MISVAQRWVENIRLGLIEWLRRGVLVWQRWDNQRQHFILFVVFCLFIALCDFLKNIYLCLPWFAIFIELILLPMCFLLHLLLLCLLYICSPTHLHHSPEGSEPLPLFPLPFFPFLSFISLPLLCLKSAYCSSFPSSTSCHSCYSCCSVLGSSKVVVVQRGGGKDWAVSLSRHWLSLLNELDSTTLGTRAQKAGIFAFSNLAFLQKRISVLFLASPRIFL